jgi:hypothetical protein
MLVESLSSPSMPDSLISPSELLPILNRLLIIFLPFYCYDCASMNRSMPSSYSAMQWIWLLLAWYGGRSSSGYTSVLSIIEIIFRNTSLYRFYVSSSIRLVNSLRGFLAVSLRWISNNAGLPTTLALAVARARSITCSAICHFNANRDSSSWIGSMVLYNLLGSNPRK